jgi:undecaprenyl-diphosphatase
MISPTVIVSRLGAHDRTLFLRFSLVNSSQRARLCWTILTNLGGARPMIVAAILPLFFGGSIAAVAQRALLTLFVSHVVVQLIKRTVGRPRPSRGTRFTALAAEPDRFSFPSGHAAAAMSIAFVYAVAYPTMALPLVLLAVAIGMSRVFLGVHYPGDVVIGQIIAVATGIFAMSAWR